MSAPIQSSCFVQMTFIISFFYKFLQNKLIYFWYSRADKSAPFFIQRTYSFRQDKVTHPNRRSYRFWKSSDVNYLSASVISLQSRNWFSFITKLTVIIIFYNKSLFFFLRPFQKFHSPFYRHNYSKRILMRRHHKCDICIRFTQFVHTHSFVIHIDSTHFIWQIFKQTIRLLVCRILQCDFMFTS